MTGDGYVACYRIIKYKIPPAVSRGDQGNFPSVVVCEEVDEWAVGFGNEGGGMLPSSVYLFRKEEYGEELAHAYASGLCEYLDFKTYILRRFTDKAYVFRVCTLDANKGEVREEHFDDWR